MTHLSSKRFGRGDLGCNPHNYHGIRLCEEVIRDDFGDIFTIGKVGGAV